jgi:hypothetical protein
MTRGTIASDGYGNLATVLHEIRKALTTGAVSIIVTVDADWSGCELLVTRPVGSSDVDELAALHAAARCIAKELKDRA